MIKFLEKLRVKIRHIHDTRLRRVMLGMDNKLKSLVDEVAYIKTNISSQAAQKVSYNGFHAEDAVIYELFNKASDIDRKGFYVDIGAYKPKEYSLSYVFYQKGWRGINVEPAPGSKAIFDLERPGDVNLECAVSNKDGHSNLIIFENSQENTIEESSADEYAKFFNKSPLSSVLVQTRTLAGILDEYNTRQEIIDFLSVDVEGAELKVLESNNWDKYKSKIIAVEQLEVASLEDLANSEIYKFLKSKNYEFFSKTPCTVFYYNKEVYDMYKHLSGLRDSRGYK